MINIKKIRFWALIWINFPKFGTKYFDKLNNTHFKVSKDYSYLYQFWFNNNVNFTKTFKIFVLKVVTAN